jgi:hypothetical protein
LEDLGILGNLSTIEVTNSGNLVGLLYFSTLIEQGKTFVVFGSDDGGALDWVGKSAVNPLTIAELFGQTSDEGDTVGLLNYNNKGEISFLPLFTLAKNGPDYFHDLFNEENKAQIDNISESLRLARPVSAESPATDEHDLEPNYIQEISVPIMGVQINAQLITDKSLDPKITEVSVNPTFTNFKGETSDEAIAEFVARTFFSAWWKNGEVKHTGVSTEEDFTMFMDLLSKARNSGNPTDWEKVQINSVWANDLNDNNGNEQEEFSILPMYEGKTPEGVRAINNFSLVFVDSDRVDNIEFPDAEYGRGYSLNLDNGTLYAYIGIYEGGPVDTTSWSLLRALSLLPNYMTYRRVSGLEDTEMMKILATKVISNGYRSSIRVYEANGERNAYEKQYNP